jgi:hypothetical protein
MRKAHGEIEKEYQKKNADIFISSRRGKTHMIGSFHPDGNAEDIIDRAKLVTKAEMLNALAIRFGKDHKFQIVEYDWGYHLEFDNAQQY